MSDQPPQAYRPVAVPLHRPDRFGFVPGGDRDHWWGRLGADIRQRIGAAAGPTIDWWAWRHDANDQPYAVVLGTDALVTSIPDRHGRQELTLHRLVPDSLTEAHVQQRPADAARIGEVADDQAAAPSLTISEGVRGFLGNLPAEAQQLMQEPFVTGDRVRSDSCHYFGTDEDVAVWCFLAGRAHVTFVSGRRLAPAGAPPHAATWDLICRRARVLR
ncbi:hypothetical protein GCM10010168_68780 [Actinoplanes ianthinogenes]|uniref:Uncharacterized protein n=1 Tax=Actinoplanes ianthinogenes TaxID=122358 RepID=A0ABM7M0G4_9ACTN|nr:hypothetical protein [Actinoplanes ianthinogenes]BCJ45078.1 hypothetical protein Aiant_57350 [Actinoplanes ianthinogenes]GGR40429.1 hypothetical protein GCM10010168_68780 [Actinoplanes ianthinogenes]